MSVIALSHITKDYGGGHGVFDVSFAVEQGEVFGFLGPNGAGKTTTIRQLMGFLAPDSGTCTINGLDCRTQTAAIQKNMGYIPGEPALPRRYARRRVHPLSGRLPRHAGHGPRRRALRAL